MPNLQPRPIFATLLLASSLLTVPNISHAGALKDIIKLTLGAIVSGAASGAGEAAYKDLTEGDKEADSSAASSDSSGQSSDSDDQAAKNKRANTSQAVRSVMEYYHYISQQDVDGVQDKWVNPASHKAINAVQITKRGGGNCQVDDGSVKSYSDDAITLYLEVVCDEGEKRGDRRYKINFDLEKVGSGWLIDDFTSA